MNPATGTQQTQTDPISVETWEIETVQRQFPQFSEEQIRGALERCKQELGDDTAHEKMMHCVEEKLK